MVSEILVEDCLAALFCEVNAATGATRARIEMVFMVAIFIYKSVEESLLDYYVTRDSVLD